MNPLNALEQMPWFAVLLLPLSGSASHDISVAASWHGRLMVFAWGVLIPLGIFTARYFKITPKQDWPNTLDSKLWWRTHLVFQNLGFLMTLIGLYLIWGHVNGVTAAQLVHAFVGYALIGLAFIQTLSGYLRGTKGGPTDLLMRGDHYDMSTRRKIFEYLHKSVGWFAVLAALAAIVLGLVVADAPRWMLLSLIAWWLALAVLACVWQRQGRCVDTYQAIWGTSTEHPGNLIKPIGWGIVRKAVRNKIN